MKKDCVNVLTYDIPFHRKTYDTLNLLKASGYDSVNVFAFPLHYEKKIHPLIAHRPDAFCATSGLPGATEQCSAFSYGFIPVKEFSEITHTIDGGGVFLICGAGILPDSFVRQNTVINAHPGYIPIVRGLDSLKWAVYNGEPIGVTTHLIGDEVDAGEVIERQLVPVYWNDTFHAVAQRQYEMEIQMLVRSLGKLDEEHEFFKGEGIIHKRMPHSYETRLFERFDALVKNIQITENT